jgi:hypothetical protein
MDQSDSPERTTWTRSEAAGRGAGASAWAATGTAGGSDRCRLDHGHRLGRR